MPLSAWWVFFFLFSSANQTRQGADRPLLVAGTPHFCGSQPLLSKFGPGREFAVCEVLDLASQCQPCLDAKTEGMSEIK
jgi:hypothetical protein